MVATEGKHGKRVTTDITGSADCCCRCLGTEGGSQINTEVPVEGLVNERHGILATTAENEGAHRHALGILPVGVDAGALVCRRGKAGIGVCCHTAATRGPFSTLPVGQLCRRFVGQSFPPDIAVFGQGNIGKNGVGLTGSHGVRVGLVIGAGSHAKVAVLRINRIYLTVRTRLDPGNIIANCGNLPPLVLERLGWNQHGEVGLAASAWESCTDIGLLAGRRFYAKDEHVLGQPPFIIGNFGSDPQGQTLLAEEGVAAVAGADAPDRVVFGEMEDQAALDVQFGLAVQALGELAAGAELLEHVRPDVGHDPHVQHHVDAVGQFHPDLAEGRPDRPHGERDHVHRPAPHRPLKDLLRPAVALLRRHPVVGRPGVFAQRGADVSQILGPSNIVDRRAVIEAAGELALVELHDFPAGNGFASQVLLLLFRAVDPDDAIGLAHAGHLRDPFVEFVMLSHRFTYPPEVDAFGCLPSPRNMRRAL